MGVRRFLQNAHTLVFRGKWGDHFYNWSPKAVSVTVSSHFCTYFPRCIVMARAWLTESTSQLWALRGPNHRMSSPSSIHGLSHAQPAKNALPRVRIPMEQMFPQKALSPGWPSSNNLAPWSWKRGWDLHCAHNKPEHAHSEITRKPLQGNNNSLCLRWHPQRNRTPHQPAGVNGSDPSDQSLTPMGSVVLVCWQITQSSLPGLLIPHLTGSN